MTQQKENFTEFVQAEEVEATGVPWRLTWQQEGVLKLSMRQASEMLRQREKAFLLASRAQENLGLKVQTEGEQSLCFRFPSHAQSGFGSCQS